MKITSLVLLLSIVSVSQSSLQMIEDKKQCLAVLLFTGLSSYKVYQDIKNQNTDQAVMQALDTLKLVYLDYKCFTQNTHELEFSLNTFKDDRKECFLQHFQKAIEELKDSMIDLLEFNFEQFASDFNLMVQTLQDALDNC
jgi:hypothetical protein